MAEGSGGDEHGPGRRPVWLPVYSGLLGSVLLGGLPFWLWRMLRRERYRAGLLQRLGRLPAGLAGPGPTVWVHAVSVGEVLAAVALVEAMRAELAEGWRLLVSTTTETGQRLACERFPGATVFYLPLDFAVLMRRSLRAAAPDLLVLMESELWPNLLVEAERARCRVAVVNARISDRSFPRYRRLRPLWRPLLRTVDLFLAQGEETAGRLQRLGVPPERVRVAGNLKYDLKPARQGAAFHALEALRASGLELLVAGSTLEGEETLLLEAWRAVQSSQPRMRLVLAPRHPARFEGVQRLIKRAGLSVARVSDGRELPGDAGTVMLLDTVGDLAGVYALATLAFVGGSLVRAGGHNPLEPARFGVPVVMGSSYENFREISDAMRRAGAMRVLPPGCSAGEMAKEMRALLEDRVRLETMGTNGAALVRREAGAATRAAEFLAGMMPEGKRT